MQASLVNSPHAHLSPAYHCGRSNIDSYLPKRSKVSGRLYPPAYDTSTYRAEILKDKELAAYLKHGSSYIQWNPIFYCPEGGGLGKGRY